MLQPRYQNCLADFKVGRTCREIMLRPNIDKMQRFQIRVPEIRASDFQIPDSVEGKSSHSGIGGSEAFLPTDYESHPAFSYNIDTDHNLTWDSDARSLHESWMKKANTSVSHDRYPHAAIKRLMRLNPEVFQVCAEVLAPLSLLADMFVGQLLLGACHKEHSTLTEKEVIHSAIAPNPLLMWALDAIDVDELLDLQPDDDIKIVANFLPELIVRNYPVSVRKKLIVAHFKLLEESEGPLGEIPQIIDANGRVITKSDVLGEQYSADTSFNVGFLLPSRHMEAPNRPGAVEDQYRDYPFTSEIQMSTESTQNQSSREIEDIMTSGNHESTLNAMSPRDCIMYSPHMEYVSFFSHIDPNQDNWFEGDFGSPPDNVKHGGTALQNMLQPLEQLAAW